MNRIYQGKVVSVEIVDGDGETGEIGRRALDDWSTRLWQHHEVFHDAVNYYTLALAALAEGVPADSAKGKAVLAWRDQVRENWVEGRRRALRYEGPHRRLAPLLGIDPDIKDASAAFDACAKAVLLPNGASPIQRADALIQLLEEADKSDLKHVCRDRIVPLCSPSGKCDATPKDIVAEQTRKMLAAIQKLHNYAGSNWSAIADELEPGWFVTRTPDKLLQGLPALKEALKRFQMACEDDRSLAEHSESFKAALHQRGDTFAFYSPGRKVKGPYSLAVVFKLWPCAVTAEALKRATLYLLKKTSQELVSDPIFVVRINDAPVFDYFTNRAFHRAPDDDNQAVWKEFDITAFIEAIKAPHRYFQDTQRRENDAAKLRGVIASIESQGVKDADDDEDTGPRFGFAEDARIDLLRELVTDPEKGLAYLAEGEGIEAKEYTIQQRTLRGWSAIRDRWRALAENGEASPEKLWGVVVDEQAAHRDDFGSAPLYRKLMEPRYQPIWRDKGTKPWHADDPLRAWQQYMETRLDLKDKEDKIRFTPAHAIRSPRYFIFPKEGRWGSEHERGSLAFSAGIAVRRDDNRWRVQEMRFHYAAPRLKRDELRRSDEEGLDAMPWVQPMMKALGLVEPDQQNFGKCRVTLQSERRRVQAHQIASLRKRGVPLVEENGEWFELRHQLAFPVEIDSTKLIEFIGAHQKWSLGVVGKEKKKRFLQFNLSADKDQFETSLRWPCDVQFSKEAGRERKSEPNPPWYEKLDGFQCLSIDLGQRDAGAYALLDVRANHDFGDKPSRFIGETPNKRWRAAVAASGMLRLSGENRREWRAKTAKDRGGADAFAFREELYGSRGRMPRPQETDECRLLMEAFLGKDGVDTFLPAGWDDPRAASCLSFPEQNDKLLVAARRAQSRVARLHRWCWFLGDETKRVTALDEIREALKTEGETGERWVPAALQAFAVADNDPRLLRELRILLESRLKELPGLLVRLANRILPLRGRSWQWGPHPEATKENRIFLLNQQGPALDGEERRTWLRGQRGLSMARIEQIEELRRRFQSLNQTLRREIGAGPPKRRDESVPDPCPDLLDKLDRLKEQRINQTAHMILAEALGVRLAAPPANKAVLKVERDQHGVYKKVRAPVDFIVMEDLSRYRASQGRAPRENSRLMKWCHRQVRDKLRELCEPFGIPVLETPAAYSSRFCSRTGVPGFRAVEVTAGFENEAPWRWLKDKQHNGKLTDEAMFLRRTAEELHAAQRAFEGAWKLSRPGESAPRRTLLLPQAGGPIFVPVCDFVSDEKLRAAVVQADINAAINLGLRAIADPRLWTIHPRLRTERIGGDIKKRGRKKSPPNATGLDGSDQAARLRAREKRKYGENGPPLDVDAAADAEAVSDARNPNYFFDVAGVVSWDRASVPDPRTGELVNIVSGKALWKTVKDAQWKRCRDINAARLQRWKALSLERSDVPF